jgi:hypothetical protein
MDRATEGPSIDLPLIAQVSPADGNVAHCPLCGGWLDLCQPNPDDGAGAELVGVCVDCDRLSYVCMIADSMAVAILLPTCHEVGRKALSALQGA